MLTLDNYENYYKIAYKNYYQTMLNTKIIQDFVLGISYAQASETIEFNCEQSGKVIVKSENLTDDGKLQKDSKITLTTDQCVNYDGEFAGTAVFTVLQSDAKKDSDGTGYNYKFTAKYTDVETPNSVKLSGVETNFWQTYGSSYANYSDSFHNYGDRSYKYNLANGSEVKGSAKADSQLSESVQSIHNDNYQYIPNIGLIKFYDERLYARNGWISLDYTYIEARIDGNDIAKYKVDYEEFHPVSKFSIKNKLTRI